MFALGDRLPKGFDDLGSPWVYESSAVAPSVDGTRGGFLEFSVIAEGIARLPADAPLRWARFGVENVKGQLATVVLSREQVRAMRDELTTWLDQGVDGSRR